MQIHSISKVIAFPLLLAAGYGAYRMFDHNYSDRYPFILIPVVLLTVLYISYGQIDYWWLKKYPVPLDDKIKKWLIEYLPFYNNLDSKAKAEFEKRLSLYVEAREFKLIGNKELNDVPFDVKNIISTQALKLCLGLDDFLIKDLDRIYLYKHPFPSPRFQFLHTYETDIIDGVVILSLEQAIIGIVQPKIYYNITLHAFAEAFIHLHPQYNYPDVNKYGWQIINEISPLKQEVIVATCGFENLDLLPVHIVCFFEYADVYQNKLPLEYEILIKILNP